MTFNITQELKRTFGLAGLRIEAAKKLNAEEWKKYQAITKRFAGQKQFEQRAHEIEYDTRVEVARKRLINKAGSKAKDFIHPWFRNDRFDKSAINLQARRQVRAEHQRLMAHLETKEIGEVQSLMDACDKRHQAKEKPTKDFARATDRRQGHARRRKDKGPTHHHSRGRT